jgi:hypothetical protein
MILPVRHALLLAGLGLGPGLMARAETALAPSSPFLPPGVSSAAGVVENTPLELRGILMDAGGYRFSVYDPVRHTGLWVRLDEPGHDFVVKAHDIARDAITLNYQGRVLTLPLHTAKVVGVAVAEPSSGPRPTPVGPGVGPVPMPMPMTPEEAERFNRAREEIARRRALRDQAASPRPN